jgi:hypothetical protein
MRLSIGGACELDNDTGYIETNIEARARVAERHSVGVGAQSIRAPIGDRLLDADDRNFAFGIKCSKRYR